MFLPRELISGLHSLVMIVTCLVVEGATRKHLMFRAVLLIFGLIEPLQRPSTTGMFISG